MRLTSACLALGLTGLVAATLPAAAGDLYNGGAGGLKDYGAGGVAVPAPMPYEETFKWYLRGDIGTAFKNSGTINNDGFPVSYSSPTDWRELSIVSLGFGQYVSPSFRTEFTVDIRTDRHIAHDLRTPAGFSLTQASADGLTSVTNSYASQQDGNINYRNYTFLASGFYDFNQGGRLRPYVGAGIGVAYHQLHRNDAELYSCTGGTTTVANGAPTAGCNTATGLQMSYLSSSSGGGMGYGLAAQLSAGLSYDIAPRIHWDTGYRFLWQGGNLAVVSDEGLNAIRLGNQINHEVRTGLRWDLW